jgi:hemolysin III
MIAATYTPFILIEMNTPFGLSLLGVVWAIAVVGIVLQLFAPRYLGRLSVALYLIQGWAVLAALEPLMSALPGRVLTLLMAGGVLYTVGVVFHLWERLPYQNAIWHGFVLSAATCHFAAVIFVVAT